MKYAEVAVDAPLAHNHTLSYSIPLGMHLEPGSVVWAPILSRPVQGVVFGIQDRPQVEVTKDILFAIRPCASLEVAASLSHLAVDTPGSSLLTSSTTR